MFRAQCQINMLDWNAGWFYESNNLFKLYSRITFHLLTNYLFHYFNWCWSKCSDPPDMDFVAQKNPRIEKMQSSNIIVERGLRIASGSTTKKILGPSSKKKILSSVESWRSYLKDRHSPFCICKANVVTHECVRCVDGRSCNGSLID